VGGFLDELLFFFFPLLVDFGFSEAKTLNLDGVMVVLMIGLVSAERVKLGRVLKGCCSHGLEFLSELVPANVFTKIFKFLFHAVLIM
jgi:hypothetical protein